MRANAPSRYSTRAPAQRCRACPNVSPCVKAAPTSALIVINRTRSASPSSAFLRAVISRKTRTAPIIFPSASRIGAALSSMGRSVPSRAIRIVWFASPTTTPSFRARKAGFATVLRVCSLTILNTNPRGWPSASCSFQAVSSWATEFKNLTLPSVSVAITASPMPASVVRNHSRCSWRTTAAWWRARRLRWSNQMNAAIRPSPTRAVTRPDVTAV